MKSLLIAIIAMGFVGTAQAKETAGEKAAATKNDVKRAAKKGMHRGQEAVCAEGDATCLAEKAKHRTTEGTDYMKDKAKEGSNKVD